MIPHDFYSEKKWCHECNRYVRYMISLEHSYCTRCGTKVALFSEEDRDKFLKSLERKKFKAS